MTVGELTGIATCAAATVTSVATLVYVVISSRALRAVNQQTATLRSSLEVTWLGLRFDAVVKQIDILDSIRDERHVVYSLTDDHALWSVDERAAVEKVIRVFDTYGLLDRNGFVPRSLLYQFYAYPVGRLWNTTSKYVKAHRDAPTASNPLGRNQPGHMWELEKLYERSKQAPKHPAESGTPDWPPTRDDFILHLLSGIDGGE